MATLEAKQVPAAVSSSTDTDTERQRVNLFKQSMSLYLSITAILMVMAVAGIVALSRISTGSMIFFLALCGFLVLEVITAIYIDRKGISDL